MKLQARFTPIADRMKVFSLNGIRHTAAGPVDLQTAVREALEGWDKDAGDPKAAVELVRRAHGGDADAAASLNALRVEQINNFIYPSLNFAAAFFQIVELAPADRPVIQNETKQETAVGYIGEDGSPKRVKLTNPTAETLIPLKLLTTEAVGYRLHDVYNGDIAASAQKNVDVAFDMANKMDALAYTLLTASLVNGGAFGTFTVTGTKVSRVWVANSRIVTANLPDSNSISLTGNGASTLFRLAAIRAIDNYCNRWANCFPDGPLRPTGRVIVPSLDAGGLAEEIVPEGSATKLDNSQDMGNRLATNYTSFDYLGTRWMIVPDNTLAAGTAYVQLNKPVGTIYTKPSMDEVFEEVQRSKNWAERSMQKVVGFAIQAQHRPRVLRVIYRS